MIAILLKSSGIEFIPSYVAWPDRIPAIIAPRDEAKNHTPIIWPTNLFGDRFDIAAKPIGLKVSSPIVWNKYVNNNHFAPATPSWRAMFAPLAINKNPTAMKIKPKPNLNGNDGSSIFLPRKNQR